MKNGRLRQEIDYTTLVSFVLIKKMKYELHVMFSKENNWGIHCDS